MPDIVIEKKSRRASLPAYGRIEQDMRSKIQNGRWGAGMRVPGRKALSEEYGVSVGTIQLAIATLLEDGYLLSESRRGTFVNGTVKLTKPLLNIGDDEREQLRTQKQTTIGILACLGPDQMDTGNSAYDGFRMPMLKSLERTLSGEGRVIEFRNMASQPNTAESLRLHVSALIERGASGLVFLFEENRGVLEALLSLPKIESIPVVWISASELPYPIPHVYWNNNDAAYEAASHIIRRGYNRNIVFLAPFSESWVDERIAGVRKAVQAAGLPESILKVLPEDRSAIPYLVDQRAAGYLAAKEFFQAGLLNDAGIIAANDNVGIGVLRAAEDENLVAGVHYGVIGFDDVPQGRIMGLSTISPPLEALGHEAASLMLRSLAGEKVSANVRLGSHLVPRASTQSVAEPAG